MSALKHVPARCEFELDKLILKMDAGSGFDPGELPNPVAGEHLLASHGRGIFLINQLIDDVRFSFESGTAISMRKNPPPNKK